MMNGTIIVFPWSLRDEYLNVYIHGTLESLKCCAREKSTVYWPGIDKDITDFHMMNTVWKHVIPATYLVQTLGTLKESHMLLLWTIIHFSYMKGQCQT